MKTLPALLAVTALAAPAASQVVLSEMNFTPQNASDDRWIELANLSLTPIDLTNWSIYYATKTTGMPNTYWWAFPAGTTIPGGGFLRVHWFEPVQTATATDIWTGQSIFHFLFGYGGEALTKPAGALALLSTVENSRMNNPSVFRDWVSWGGNGFARENIAISANRWIKGQRARRATGKESVALDYGQHGTPTPASAWFRDKTPTPLAPNAIGTKVRSYGFPCSVGAFQTPTLEVMSVPVSGNPDFGFRIRGTDATLNQQIALIIGLGELGGIVPPIAVMSCPLWVNLTTFVTIIGPATPGKNHTNIPLPLTNIGPTTGSIFCQALIVPIPLSPTDHSATQGLEVAVGQ